MQPCTPPGQITRSINGHGAGAVPVVDRDQTKQFDGQPSAPASDTRSHRADPGIGGASMRGCRLLTLDHG